MSREIINTILLSGAFLALFALAEVLYHSAKVKAEITRKIAHAGTGLLTLLFPILIENHWLVLLLCSAFAAILLLSLMFNFLKSINAIDRVSSGSLCYPLAVYVCYLGYDHYGRQPIYFYLPILGLAICDPVAALTGKRWPLGKYRVGADHKSLMGSSMFFLSFFLISLFLFILNGNKFEMTTLLLCAAMGTAGAVAEAISGRGYDNLSIPITSLALMIGVNELTIFSI